jgi:hypothetical protein
MKTRTTRYYFHVFNGPIAARDHDGAEFCSEASARSYAEQVIRDLKDVGGYDDPSLSILIEDGAGREVVSIKFLAVPRSN